LLTKLKRLIRQHQIDIIDARLSSPIFIGAILAKLCRIRSVGTTYSIESNRTLMQRLVMQASFAMSDAIITDSEVWKNRIAKAVKLPARVENIPNGIFRPHSERPANDTREYFDIPSNPDVRIVCQISRLIEYKGHRFLLGAAQRVLQKFPNTFFLLVGHEHGENYRNDLLQLADHLGIKSRVRIAGYSGPIGDVWNITHVHAHASLLDSSPNAIIEGMSFGKPAVVTNVGGIPELVLNERTGIVVPTRDDEALSNGICMMLERPTVASRYGDLALERYRSRHTPEAMTRAHEDLFEELCKV
jgi:glycosyltransferase involved in cell wall biosynthesis